MTVKSGEILLNRYRLIQLLGQGGMGAVFKSEDELLKRTVAVKILSAPGLGSEGKARMLREAQSAATLNHSSIVTVFDAGEDVLGGKKQKTPFVVMELISGQNLAEKPPQGVEQIVEIASQLCRALRHAHSRDIIHRDVKPENVLLTEEGVAKLVDFGLARPVSSTLTTEGTIAGTLSYMAPELALGQQFDGRADLYSLGVMLYQWTTGQLPFVADNPVSIITQHLYAPVVPPRALENSLPPALDDLIIQLLAKNQEDRPADAGAVLARLESISTSGLADEQARELLLIDRFVRGRLVGREVELAEANSLWQRAITGRGQMLLISGEPGIGKTRLTRELITQVEVSGGTALIGECYSEGGGPYAPFAQIIRRFFGQGRNGIGDVPDHIMADLLNLSPNLWTRYQDVRQNPELDPQLEQQRLFENVVQFCRLMSQRAPLLLVIDDAHWADSGSVSLLRYLARRVQRLSMMIAATYREVELDENLPFNQVLIDLNRERLASRIKLGRLSKEETEQLLTTLFSQEITPEFLDAIYQEAEGNPFFIEEVCKALVDGGQLYFEEGSWQRPEMMDMIIPQSVRVAIQSRIANLPEEDQDTLRLAAVIGREFDFDTLSAASDSNEDELIDTLERAEKAQLIEPAGGVSFIFAHALIPSTLIEGVHMLRRRRLHHMAAKAVEELRPDDYEALAYHFGEAGDEQKALTYYTKAGEKASRAYANKEAVRFFQAALNLAYSQEEQAHLYSELGVVLARQSHFEEAEKHWRKAVDIYQESGRLDPIAWCFARMVRAASDAGNTKESLSIGEAGLEAVQEAPDSPELADLLHETARAYHFNGRSNEGEPLCDRALKIAGDTGAVTVQVESLITKALLVGYPRLEVNHILEQAIELCQEHDLIAQESRASNNLSISLAIHGDFTTSRRYLKRASELSRKVGDIGMEIFAGANELFWGLWQGELNYVDEALAELESTIETLVDPGTAANNVHRIRAYWLWAKGEVQTSLSQMNGLKGELIEGGDLQGLANLTGYSLMPVIELGEYDTALHLVEESIQYSDQGFGSRIFPRLLKLSLPKLWDDEKASQRLIAEIRETAKRDASVINRMWEHISEAHYSATMGQWDEGVNAFTAGLILAREMNLKLVAHWMRSWSVRLIASKRPENLLKARGLLTQTRSLFEEMGAPYYVDRVDELAAEIDKSLE